MTSSLVSTSKQFGNVTMTWPPMSWIAIIYFTLGRCLTFPMVETFPNQVKLPSLRRLNPSRQATESSHLSRGRLPQSTHKPKNLPP
jgi:hypothetical protein